MAIDGPMVDPERSFSYGTLRGHEVLLGLSRERPSAQVQQWDAAAAQLFHEIATAGLDRFFCWVRMPSLLFGLQLCAPPDGASNARLTGQPAIDENFSVRALSPPAVAPLFARKEDGGDVIDLVLQATASGAAVTIEDTYVSIAMMRPKEDAAWLAWAADFGVRIADRLTQARRAMPALPWEPAVASALEGLCRARSMRFDHARLEARGTFGEIEATAALTTTPPLYGNLTGTPSYAIEITATHPALRAGLRIFPARMLSGLIKMFLTDIKVGEPAFDEAFIVQADDAARLPGLCTAGVRARLLTMLSRSAYVAVDDTIVMMHLAARSPDAASLGHAVDDAAFAAKALLDASRAQGPSVA